MGKDNPNIKILVCCHKPGEWKSDDVYMPIHCGKAISEYDLGIQGDDTGDNISAKNSSYCELTAMYWAWKNLKDVDYIGLCHYRRYFDFNKKNVAVSDLILRYMKKNDVILPEPIFHSCSNMSYLFYSVSAEDIYITIDCLKRLYPSYEKTLIDYLFNTNKMIAFNIFLLKWDVFVKYQEWIFPLLNEIELKMKPSAYSRQRRAIAYLAEVLLPIFMLHNNYKVKFVRMERNGSSFIYEFVKKYLYALSFKMSHPFATKNVIVNKAVLLWLNKDNIKLDNL